jgi:hypothetical protein
MFDMQTNYIMLDRLQLNCVDSKSMIILKSLEVISRSRQNYQMSNAILPLVSCIRITRLLAILDYMQMSLQQTPQ